MKLALRILLTPVMLLTRLTLGLAAFVTSIASTVIGLATGLFVLLGVIEFAIGYWQNVSPLWRWPCWSVPSDCLLWPTSFSTGWITSWASLRVFSAERQEPQRRFVQNTDRRFFYFGR